ncbi:MAG: hypothetical protein CVU00_03810 [Bacteroidetes bacterium HGW-Bacteroidetes-17]|jgi:hypothetical protein|nr:MAG: hypothetical protein CVU00_03810 [Bacteroidetes bacterium HGW-Bacteroidetes-17]
MKKKYIEDLKEIKDIMNRSSRFISLSGLSGISAGITALIGAYMAHKFIFAGNDYLIFGSLILTPEQFSKLLIIACATIVVSISLVIFLTTQEIKKKKQKIWDQQTKRILLNLSIPLLAGGIISMMFLVRGYVGIVLPMTLIFYGMALVNVSKYTLNEIRSLGLIEILLGLLSLQLVGYGLIIWSIGFGVLHIVYGFIIKMKYKS